MSEIMKQKKAILSEAVKLLDDYRLYLHHHQNFKDDDAVTDALKSIIKELNK